MITRRGKKEEKNPSGVKGRERSFFFFSNRKNCKGKEWKIGEIEMNAKKAPFCVVVCGMEGNERETQKITELGKISENETIVFFLCVVVVVVAARSVRLYSGFFSPS